MPILVIGIVNFVAFWILVVRLGGDAVAGYTRNGHYYLCSHGLCTEVSQAVWRYSYVHTISVCITWPLVFITAAILLATGDMKLSKGT